jgi:hypothetical protein
VEGINDTSILCQDDVAPARAEELDVHDVTIEEKADHAIVLLLCHNGEVLTDEFRKNVATIAVRSAQRGSLRNTATIG